MRNRAFLRKLLFSIALCALSAAAGAERALAGCNILGVGEITNCKTFKSCTPNTCVVVTCDGNDIQGGICGVNQGLHCDPMACTNETGYCPGLCN